VPGYKPLLEAIRAKRRRSTILPYMLVRETKKEGARRMHIAELSDEGSRLTTNIAYELNRQMVLSRESEL